MKKILKLLTILVLLAVIIAAGIKAVQQNKPVKLMDESNNILEAPTGKPKFIATARFACDGDKTFTADFFNDITAQKPVEPGQPPVPTGSVQLMFEGQDPLILRQTISADGGRYANDDESFIFWTKGNGAFIMQNNQNTYTNCIATYSSLSN